VVGYTSSWGAGSKEVLFVKFDSHGNMEQVNTFGHTGIEVGMSVCEADDGGFMICGYTNSFGYGEFDVYVIKTDSDGNGEWAEMYGGALTDIGNAIIKTSSGNYVINGSSGTYGSGNMNFWAFEIDPDGVQQWEENFGLGSDFDWGKGICETADGGFALVGDSDTHGADLLDVMLIKTDDYGFEDWRYKISRSVFYDYGNSICQTSDGGFIICGATKYTNTQKNDIYMIRTNSNGNVLWTGTYGGSESDWGSSMCITNDDDYVIVGHTESFGAGKYDVYLMKLQGDPVSVDEDETLIPESASLEQNYPNPFNNKTTITFSVKENEEAQLEIYDLYGR
ncbi:MAG: T9SS type A sorting domain-containing protein, partial [candidate division Zixibacteria bacterium]|nr:T9SS type A sorting domain-containing protein [candidate division Zixibacteria bacterium]